jgi:hypothetical protein
MLSTQEMETTSMEMTSMERKQLYASQKEALKKIAEFSGEHNELDVDEWLFDLTNLFSLMKLKDESKILETMGKLTGPALRWYQENLTSFTSWNDAEQALRDRFKKFTSDSELMQEFFQIQQEENESITAFYENFIRKYRKVKKFITEKQVITVLQNGVKNSLKEHLIRNEKDIKKPDEWLQIAREEEYIQKRLQHQYDDCYSEVTEPYWEYMLPTATIQSKPSNTRLTNTQTSTLHHHDQKQHQRPDKLVINHQNHHQHDTHTRTKLPNKKIQQTGQCLICNRKNHSTTNCFYKKDKGCYKCGQSNHRIHDCPQRHFF